MTINQSGWRPEMAASGTATGAPTATGNRALMLEEPLIFEIGSADRTGVDLEQAPAVQNRLGGMERSAPIGLPGLSEQETVRHYTRLSTPELRHRPRAVPAWVLHDEAQPAPQREGRADARLCRSASAGTAIGGAGCAWRDS
jgi:hypothetical protein